MMLNRRSFRRTLVALSILWLGMMMFVMFAGRESTNNNGDNGWPMTFRRRCRPAMTTLYWVALISLHSSILSMLLYGYDKIVAKSRKWRIAEVTLHTVALIGGWAGAALAQDLFRHKCRKTAFLQVYVATVLGNLMLVGIFAKFWGALPVLQSCMLTFDDDDATTTRPQPQEL